MNQQSDALLHRDNLRKMAINFFPFHPKAHVLWYSWARVNVIIPSVNRQSPKNWVMNLRCFLLHFLTVLQMNHIFSWVFTHDAFVPKHHQGGWSTSWGKGGEPASMLSIWGLSWELTHKGHPKEVQDWGVGKGPLCFSHHSDHTLKRGGGGRRAHPDLEIRRVLCKNIIFLPPTDLSLSENRGGGAEQAPWASPLDLPLRPVYVEVGDPRYMR